MKRRFWRLVPLAVLAVFLSGVSSSLAQEASLMKDVTSLVYFTGIGCPHCANVDPVLLKQKVRQGNLLVVEYEIYRDSANAPLLMAYHSKYDTAMGVPMIVTEAHKGGSVVGDKAVLDTLDFAIKSYKGNGVALPSGEYPFDSLSLANLPRLPKVWFKNRVAIRKDADSKESEGVKKFLLEGIAPPDCAPSQEKEVALSESSVVFGEACTFKGWLLMHD